MPYFRHRSFVFAPASASLSTPMICSSVNRRLFIRLLPDEQTLLHRGTKLGEQTKSHRSMSVDRRRAMIEPEHARLSIVRQCELVGISRSSWYYRPCGESDLNLRLMREIDEQYL